MSTRTERLADLIRDEVSRMLLLREIKDPRIGFVTVTSTEVSPDLKNVRIYVSVLGSEEARDLTLEALRGASGFVQRELFRNLRLKHSPVVSFRLDDSLERGERIERVLRQIHEGDSDPPDDPEGKA